MRSTNSSRLPHSRFANNGNFLVSHLGKDAEKVLQETPKLSSHLILVGNVGLACREASSDWILDVEDLYVSEQKADMVRSFTTRSIDGNSHWQSSSMRVHSFRQWYDCGHQRPIETGHSLESEGGGA